MKYVLLVHNHIRYIKCFPDSGMLQNESDALDLVAACGEHNAQRILLHETNLGEEFYQLRSGTAGAILQKFINYRVRVAILFTDSAHLQGRFWEMAMESNCGLHVRFFLDQDAALTWLLSNEHP